MMRMGFFRFITPIFFSLMILFGRGWYNHTELNWQTIETEHFIVHYHDETERSAREAAAVAELVYPNITAVYNYEPPAKTHLIIKDTDDYSNGAAYYYDNKIEIWARPLDFDLRGAHRWIQDVIAHEFTHIVQIQAAMKYPQRIPGFFFQGLLYEEEKRDDVLYGYPNVIISYPVPGTAVPPWLAEGTAQYMYDGANFDYWDSHRDMILRDRILNNNLLTFSEMNTFGKKGIGNESTYNQGFAFVRYLRHRFGEDVLDKITKALSNRWSYSIDKAMEKATGIPGKTLYNEWAGYLRQDYLTRTGNVVENEMTGQVLISDGTTNVHPVWSPDGTRFAYLSNRNNDYFSQTDLFIYDFSDSASTLIMPGVQTQPCWIDDSTLVYARKSKPNRHGSKLFDLYRYELSSEEETRLTTDSRLISPVFNAATGEIAAITTYDGTSNILISPLDSIDFRPVTNETNGMQMFSLDWHGDRLLVDATVLHGRQIYEVQPGGELLPVGEWGYDTRDPDGEGNLSVLSLNKSGIFNLKIKDDSGTGYITNVTGGAFMPDVSVDGKILYSLYRDGRYRIALIESPEFVDDSVVGYEPDYYRNFPTSQLVDYGVEMQAKPYEDTMTDPFFMPRLMMDYSTMKTGFYFFASDILDRMSVFGGASVNGLVDKDIFLLFDYGKFPVTFYTDLFWASRNTTQTTDVQGGGSAKNDLTIYFFSSDIGVKFPVFTHKFWLYYTYVKYRDNIDQTIQDINGNFVGDFGIAFDYYRGHMLSLKWNYSTRKPEFAGNMLPSNGLETAAVLSVERNQFIQGFGFNKEYGTYQPDFAPNNTVRLNATLSKHWAWNRQKKWVSSFSTQIGYLSNKHVYDFFYYFGGGLPGIKGYTYFDEALKGPYLWINTFTFRAPVFMEKSIPVAHMTFQNMSVGGILQAGGGFDSDVFRFIGNSEYKVSAGVELRLSGYSFFGFPTAVNYEYHIPVGDSDVTSGKQYLTVLFDF